MHIKEMTLHGFKSYGAKTTIRNFDPQFNAITGLNGCGKSNILDAICFVLCQTAPTQFRVDNLSDLVYKKGAGGISFAAVSITFDNRNKAQSPINYHKHDQIEVERRLVQGKSKYTINGTTVNQNVVQDMFRSVQLNIQNPHFLIMQGRITKVLSMKPEEIWNMVEEAAGTMVYITKRDATLKLMADKEKRMGEIDQLLEQVIKPQIERLQKDRYEEIERQKLIRTSEKLQSQVAAKTAHHLKLQADDSKEKRAQLKIREKELQAKMEEQEAQLVQINKKITALEAGDTNQSAALKPLEAAAAESRKRMLAIQSDIDSNRNQIQEETAAIEENNREIAVKTTELEAFTKQFGKIGDDLKVAEDKKKDLDLNVERAQQAVAVIVTGVGGRDNAECTSAQEKLSETDRRLNIVTGTLAQLKKAQENAAQNSSTTAKAHEKILQDMQNMQQQLTGMKEKKQSLQEVDWNDTLNNLRQERQNVTGRKAATEQQMQNVAARMESLNVPYRNNVRPQNIDPAKVFGAAGKLFKVKNPDFIVALDSAAGGNKWIYVVEDETTGKTLMDAVHKRIRIMPIEHCKGQAVNRKDVAAFQQRVGADKCWAAIDLVEFDPKFRTIAEYVFGRTMICTDIHVATKVAFPDRGGPRAFAVTLEGDTCNPDGLVAGGSRPDKNNTMLNHVYQHNILTTESGVMLDRLRTVQAEIAELEGRETELQRLDADIQQTTNRLNMLKLECDRNQGLRDLMDGERRKEEIAELEKELANGKVLKADLEMKIADFKKKMSSANAEEVEKREAEGNEAKCREAVRKQMDAVNRVLRQLEKCQSDMDNARTSTENLQQEIAGHQTRITELKAKIAKKNETLVPVAAEHENAAKKYNDLREGLAKQSTELQEGQAQKRTLEKEQGKTKRQHQQTKDDMNAHKETLRSIEKKLNEELFQQHPWLAEEFDKFGTPESTYKVEDMNLAALKEELEKCNKKRAALQRSIGGESNTDFENIKKQYDDLINKGELCKSDKRNLTAIIENLDLKKQELIEMAVAEVNKHFGSIFAALLPNANCKLEREKDAQNQSIEALRIRVALSNTRQKEWLWKDSLSELSGGQRSLVALSLILAMLKMNPAPVYVLDEIDAALDLSHTQNVGKMIRKHFKQSQFVIVSLKEGMFNNANMLFRVEFQDGVSKVIAKARARSIGNGNENGNGLHEEDEEDHEEDDE